jgi:hypothetical protein
MLRLAQITIELCGSETLSVAPLAALASSLTSLRLLNGAGTFVDVEATVARLPMLQHLCACLPAPVPAGWAKRTSGAMGPRALHMFARVVDEVST